MRRQDGFATGGRLSALRRLPNGFAFDLDQIFRGCQPGNLKIGRARRHGAQFVFADSAIQGDGTRDGDIDRDLDQMGLIELRGFQDVKQIVEGLFHLRLKPFDEMALGRHADLPGNDESFVNGAVGNALAVAGCRFGYIGRIEIARHG
jgi:hypothetical protein